MNTLLQRELALVRADEMRRRAAGRLRGSHDQPRRRLLTMLRRAYVRRVASGRPVPAEADIRIRFGRPDEVAALHRLAALDDAGVPPSPVLVAEVGRELWAARSLDTGDVIATPFEWTQELVELLAIRAEQLRAASAVLDRHDDPGRPRRSAAAHVR